MGRDLVMTALGLFLGCLAISVYIAAPSLSEDIRPIADIAADMLLADRIHRGEWLTVGHYSRFEFHHPGPFWFYWNTAWEALLAESTGRLKAWLWGSMVTNAALVAFAATALGRFLSDRPGEARAIAAVTALAALGTMGRDLADLWMPVRMEAPVFAWVVCAIGVASGRMAFLVPGLVLAAMVSHGYASLSPILLQAGLPALAAGLLLPRGRRGLVPALAAGLLLVLPFALPVLVELRKGEAGNIAAILRVTRSFAQAPDPVGLPAAAAAVLERMGPGLRAGGVLLAAALAWTLLGRRKVRPGRMAVLALLAVPVFAASAVAVHVGTPAPLHGFVLAYLGPLPVLLVAVAAAQLFRLTAGSPDTPDGRRAWWGARILAFGVAGLLSFPPNRIPAFSEEAWIGRFTGVLAAETRLVALDYETHGQWAWMAGLLLALSEADIPACTTWRHMGFLYTPERTCPEGRAATHRLVPAASCGAGCLVRAGDHGLVRLGLPSAPRSP